MISLVNSVVAHAFTNAVCGATNASSSNYSTRLVMGRYSGVRCVLWRMASFTANTGINSGRGSELLMDRGGLYLRLSEKMPSQKLKVGSKFIYKWIDNEILLVAEAIHKYPYGMLCQLYRAKSKKDGSIEIEKPLFKAFV